MPLARYQIRNEYGLADPEVYRGADKDDPEALLEGVAMAGLVGVLRQLGDLAEFAAEVFHDLHEEVMTTAARGHGLMARVQQLEAEVPSIEKVFLSQTDQSPYFTSPGVDWHPNLRMEQNLITRGDLPRFVMDSYEECRGPPRLFLLDKFDVAGAGACLKRYTDPSLFKVEAASSGIEMQREKKIRKVKKKGSRWRNGETPEVLLTSHTKLHQLFLEERVENNHSDPARVVRLKRRQLNGSPFDLKPGKSYMEKFLGSPSPEHKVVCEDSVNQSPLKLTLDSYSESGLEILEISTVSPGKKSSQGRKSTDSSPTGREVVLKSFTHELVEEGIAGEVVKNLDPLSDGEDDASPHVIHKMAIEDELAVDGDRKTEESLDGDHSDDLMSEVDNYMDALATMESEMETDNEYKPKKEQSFFKVGKQGTDYDANDEHLDVHANFSDSQSFGNSSMSDDGKSSFKKGRSSFSYSDSFSNVAENTPSDGEGAVKGFHPENSAAAEIADSPLVDPTSHAENSGTQFREHTVYNNMCDEEDTIPNTGEASCSSCLSDMNPVLPPTVAVANSNAVFFSETVLDEASSERIKLGPESLNTEEKVIDLPASSIVLSDPSQTSHNNLLEVSSEGCPVMDHEDRNVFVHASNMSDLEKEGDSSANIILQTDSADGVYDKHFVEGEVKTSNLVTSPLEQVPPSVRPEIVEDTGVAEASDRVNVNSVELDSKIIDVTAAMGDDSEALTVMVEPLEVDSIQVLQCSDIAGDVSQDEHDLPEVDSKVAVEGEDIIPFEIQASDSDKISLDDHVNLDEDVIASPVAVGVGANDGTSDANCEASDLICCVSSNPVDVQESISANENPHQEGTNEILLPECCEESEKQREVDQLEVASTDTNSSPYKSVSDSQSNLDVFGHVHESAIPNQIQNRDASHNPDCMILPSSEVNNQELESHLRHSVDSSEDAVSSPTCPPEVETALEHSVAMQADQNLEESSFAVIDEANSVASDLQHSPVHHLAEPGLPSGQSFDSQSDKLDAECVQSEQIEIVGDIGQERCLDTGSEQEPLPSQGLLLLSAVQEANGTVMSGNPFESVFPSFGPVPGNLEEMPPLPPLPPMQWRLGKFQPAQLASHGEWTDHGQHTFLPTQSFTTDENSQADKASLDGESKQPSNPFLSMTSADIQRSENLMAESVESSLQPTSLSLVTPTVARDVNDQQAEPEDGLPASRNPVGSSSETLSPVVTTVQNAQAEHDPEPSEGLEIKCSNQVKTESVSETMVPENSLQNVEGKARNSPDEPVSPPSIQEEQPQHDLVTSYGETTWSQSTLALPPTYAIGKPNGSKPPLPRNPLIDAVAAHDKSKLKKVTERIRPQVGPKEDERDSLLEQIRTKSFSLKPATVTRPSIQGIPGPKTNLKVAAILEKANAIRQALTGSDEDDSDSWSDS